MTRNVLLCITLLLSCWHRAAEGEEPSNAPHVFSYDHTAQNGPSHWGGSCQLVGKQSPIDIPFENILYEKSIKGLTFSNYESKSSSLHFTLTNNGHSAQVTVAGTPLHTITNGGLHGEYFLVQFHFHWGPDNFHGSEHTIEKRKFPLEVHFVHKTNSTDVPEDEKIAVVGVFFEISDERNDILDNIVKHLQNVIVPGSHEDLVPFSLSDILPLRRDRYFRYHGSLTTPPCSEQVLWTVLFDPIPITVEQEGEFRKLLEESGAALTKNYRQAQKQGERLVTSSFVPIIHSSAAELPYSLVIAVVAAMLHLM